jgi:hypothetical protein
MKASTCHGISCPHVVATLLPVLVMNVTSCYVPDAQLAQNGLIHSLCQTGFRSGTIVSTGTHLNTSH